MTANDTIRCATTNPEPKPLRPYCQTCGWRKGGPDSWNGVACKCGHNDLPIVRVDQPRA